MFFEIHEHIVQGIVHQKCCTGNFVQETAVLEMLYITYCTGEYCIGKYSTGNIVQGIVYRKYCTEKLVQGNVVQIILSRQIAQGNVIQENEG